MNTYIIRYWQGGATIKYVKYKADNETKAAKKFYQYHDGEILGIEEA